MALIVKCQLEGSRGLAKIIAFHGLDYDVVVHPTIHGEPILTSQAFYYLEQLEAIAEIRFENEKSKLPDGQIEYLIDNYFFKYSTLDPESKISTKVTEYKYWRDDYNDMYARYDQTNRNVLILDKYNDDSVLSIEPLDKEDKTDFSDWCLVKNYSDEVIDRYVKSMAELVDKKILIQVLPTSEKDGYFGKMRLMECDDGLIDYHQAHLLDYRCSPRDIKPSQNFLTLKASTNNGRDVHIPVETVELKKIYDPILLSYYFSGLKELNPLLSYVGFYNVLEYYFEEAPKILKRTVRYEKEQLECVIDLLVNSKEIYKFFQCLSSEHKGYVQRAIKTSSNVDISGFNFDTEKNIGKRLAKWLYSIRCAIVHSKKSRRGKETSIFKPYSAESENIKISIPIIKWLAVNCIVKDNEINGKL